MTPNELCEYIINGTIFDEFPSGDANHSELGRYTWPNRYSKIVSLAKDAVLTPAAPDSEGLAILEGVEYLVNNIDCNTISLIRR